MDSLEAEGYESTVVDRRIRVTDDTSGFAETLDVAGEHERFSTAADVLARTAGVQVRKTGGAGAPAMMGIRGSTSRQVPIFLNGVEIGGTGSSAVDLSDFPLDLLDTIEVYRGSAPISVGQSGIGGAVVLGTPVLKDPFNRVSGTVGSFGTRRLSVGHGTPMGNANGLTVLTIEHSDGDFWYLNRYGTRDPSATADDRIERRQNNDHTSYGALLTVGGPLAGWKWSVNDALSAKQAGVPGSEFITSKSAKLNRMRNLATANFSGPIGSMLNASFDLGYGYMTDDFRDPNDDFQQSLAYKHARTHAVPFNGRLRISWQKAGTTDVAADEKFETLRREENDFETTTKLPDVTRNRVHLGLAHRWQPVSMLSIDPAVRLSIENRRSETGGEHLNDIYASPSIGLKLDPLAWLTLRSGVGRYVRTPDLDELYGAFGAVQGNSGLKAEDALNADAGLSVHFSGRKGLALGADAAWFCSFANNLIVYEQNSQYHIRPENTGKAAIQGAETGIHAQFTDLVSIKAVYTYLYTENRSDTTYYSGKRLPGRPAHQVYAKVEAGSEGKHLGGLLWVDADFAGETYLNKYNQASVAVPARLLMGAGYRLSHKRSGIALTVEVHNLLNRITAKTATGDIAPIMDFYGFPLPGREVFLTFAWKG